jgi:hypothetical protein
VVEEVSVVLTVVGLMSVILCVSVIGLTTVVFSVVFSVCVMGVTMVVLSVVLSVVFSVVFSVTVKVVGCTRVVAEIVTETIVVADV